MPIQILRREPSMHDDEFASISQVKLLCNCCCIAAPDTRFGDGNCTRCSKFIVGRDTCYVDGCKNEVGDWLQHFCNEHLISKNQEPVKLVPIITTWKHKSWALCARCSMREPVSKTFGYCNVCRADFICFNCGVNNIDNTWKFNHCRECSLTHFNRKVCSFKSCKNLCRTPEDTCCKKHKYASHCKYTSKNGHKCNQPAHRGRSLCREHDPLNRCKVVKYRRICTLHQGEKNVKTMLTCGDCNVKFCNRTRARNKASCWRCKNKK